MSVLSTKQDARNKIRQVFRFLAEFQKVRTPPVRQITEYDWHLYFADLPNDPSIEIAQIITGGTTPLQTDAPALLPFLLQVRRPKETPCPAPPEVLRDWLLAGWHIIDDSPTKLDARNLVRDGNTVTERFDANPERVRAFAAWNDKRNAWLKAERPVRDAMRVFRKLFELRGRLEREAERFQLYLGDGLLRVADAQGVIDHPLLLQKVELQFDEKTPAFKIVETDDAPELHTGLLSSIPQIDGSRTAACRKDLEAHAYHPLGTEDSEGFLRRIVHSLFADGRFVRDPPAQPKPDAPFVYRKPVLYLAPRAAGVATAIDSFLRRLAAQDPEDDLPPALARVVGFDSTQVSQPPGLPVPARPRSSDPGDIDLLLTKPANPEQERVIQRLSATNTVLVQGPPGTGKTHTIANLIGHLLAQGKSILVTSHTARALRMVRQSVVEDLRPLCVSVLDTDLRSRSELEDSVKGIATRLSATDLQHLEQEAERLRSERDALRTRIKQLRQDLDRAIKDEYDSIVVGGEPVTPANAARWVLESIGTHDWIPGPLTGGSLLPLTHAEVQELYQLNELLPPADECDLAGSLPPAESLPSGEEFQTLAQGIRYLQSLDLQGDDAVWPPNAALQSQDLAALRLDLLSALTALECQDRWFRECLEAGILGGDYRTPWDELLNRIEESRRRIAEWNKLVITHGPTLQLDACPAEPTRTCQEIIDRLKADKALRGWFSRNLPREWQQLVAACTVDGREPKTVEDFEAIHAFLSIRQERDQLRRRWDRQLTPLGIPLPEAHHGSPEEYCLQFLPRIRDALAWHDHTWNTCQQRVESIGIRWSVLLAEVAPVAGICTSLRRLEAAARNQVFPILQRRESRLKLEQLLAKHTELVRTLHAVHAQDDPGQVLKRVRLAVSDLDPTAYSEAWSRVVLLNRQRRRLQRRSELLAKLGPSAPGWADAIQRRAPPHDTAEIPGDLQRAWLHRQWAEEIDRRAAADIDKLQQALNELRDHLQETTSRFVSCCTWAAQRKRIGLPEQQALVGWLDLVRKPGFSTGVRSATLKAAARRQLALCRPAVPVWIMPLSRVADSYDFASTMFDVVIIDEASQSDVTGILAFALGREIIVVGDHEQVSPYAVGQNATQVQALINQHLQDVPNNQLYDGRTSIYDLARQSFGETIRLVEHFRCVPEIIQFSNHLSYGGEIKPLRDSSTVVTRPFVLAHRVPGGRAEKKVNLAEAEEVASLLIAATEQPEYGGLTMGVISMVGDEQGMEIDKLLQRHLPEAAYAARRIVCGNPGQFQGDERDVVFLSLVDSSPTGRPLHRLQSPDLQRRFNVAASRARDQLWVVHSLNPGTDVKDGDLRFRLIQHAEDPTAISRVIIQETRRADSEFERQVIKRLIHRGYRARSQWPVGAYKIDIVVFGHDGRKAAIECDGDRYHTPENLREDMDRQMLMERLGWRFIRIRSTRFFSDPDSTMARVYDRLDQLEVSPVGPEADNDPEKASDNDELRHRVIRRAEAIRREWRDQEQGAIALVGAASARQDTGTKGKTETQEALLFPKLQTDPPTTIDLKSDTQPTTAEPPSRTVGRAELAPDGKPWEYVKDGYWWQWFPGNGRRTRGRKA